jgi:pimeloyl-ACP methyl ester carboxylesterase
MRQATIAATTLCAAVCAATPAPAQTSPDPLGYCVPQRTDHDPQDLERERPPVVLPPGWTSRRVRASGVETALFETGPRESAEAVVFIHGTPGNSLDWLGLLGRVPPGARAVAFDVPGFGQADKPWDRAYTLAEGAAWLEAMLDELGVERVHIVGHDNGSITAIEWASRRPRRLASATIFAGGVMIGYEDHYLARQWRTPVQGENLMKITSRQAYYDENQRNNPRPLPREFFDRDYDYFDRATRCAVLKAYRSAPANSEEFARPQAERLRPHDLPALVLWGDKDPFISPQVAQNQREAFPHAEIHIFEATGHWPFVDEEKRSGDLMRRFLGAHVREQSSARVQVAVSPRRVRAGRRTRFRIRTLIAGQPLAGARVSFAGRKLRTDRAGRAVLSRVLWRPRPVPARAAKGAMRKGRTTVRVLPARPRR